MQQRSRILAAAVTIAALCAAAAAQEAGSFRVLKPEFVETGHVPPSPTQPPPRGGKWAFADTAALAAALALAGHVALKKRSRRMMVELTVLSILYFGFWRRGCVCPVGATQNITQAVLDPAYSVPAVVAVFFVLPLLFTLFHGRTFCAAVCPLGAIQEVVLFRPVLLPRWVSEGLGTLRYLHLGLAVVFVAEGAGYLICRYDPFVGFYRLGASFPMLVYGAGTLVLAMFVGRPYCRFLCAYGLILGWLSRFSRRHVTITPAECIRCRLCEDACPYGAILPPTPDVPPESRRAGARRLTLLLLLAPLLVLAAAAVGDRLAVPLSLANREVRLAERVRREETGRATGKNLDSEIWRRSKETPAALYSRALATRDSARRAGRYLGAFIGLAFGGKLLALSVRRRRADYTPDPATCLSCARCFMSCPKERERRAEDGRQRAEK